MYILVNLVSTFPIMGKAQTDGNIICENCSWTIHEFPGSPWIYHICAMTMTIVNEHCFMVTTPSLAFKRWSPLNPCACGHSSGGAWCILCSSCPPDFSPLLHWQTHTAPYIILWPASHVWTGQIGHQQKEQQHTCVHAWRKQADGNFSKEKWGERQGCLNSIAFSLWAHTYAATCPSYFPSSSNTTIPVAHIFYGHHPDDIWKSHPFSAPPPPILPSIFSPSIAPPLPLLNPRSSVV